MELILHDFLSLTSTNDQAKKILHLIPKNYITVIRAQEQTQGRGRYQRKWFSPKGQNLYASFVAFLKDINQEPLLCTYLLALSAAEELTSYSVPCKIKKPNDLLVNSKKIGGILCECPCLNHQSSVILGIGLNINMKAKLLAKVDQPATSLQIETGQKWSVQTVCNQLAHRFANHWDLFVKKGFSPFAQAFHKFID